MSFGMGMKAGRDAFADIETIIKRMANPTSQNLDRVEKAVRFGFASNFARQAAPDIGPWAPLAPRTQRERIFGGYNPTSPILVRTGAYRASWTIRGFRQIDYRTDGWTMMVGSNDPRVGTHEAGNTALNVPVRAVGYLDTGSIGNIASAINDMADRVVRTL